MVVAKGDPVTVVFGVVSVGWRVVGLTKDDVRLGGDVETGRSLFLGKEVSLCVEDKFGVKDGDVDVGVGMSLSDGRLKGDDNGRLVGGTIGCRVGCIEG